MNSTEQAITTCQRNYGELTAAEQTALEIVSMRWQGREQIPSHHMATVDAAAQRLLRAAR